MPIMTGKRVTTRPFASMNRQFGGGRDEKWATENKESQRQIATYKNEKEGEDV